MKRLLSTLIASAALCAGGLAVAQGGAPSGGTGTSGTDAGTPPAASDTAGGPAGRGARADDVCKTLKDQARKDCMKRARKPGDTSMGPGTGAGSSVDGKNTTPDSRQGGATR